MICDTISVKVRWKQWCRWNCDLRVINARKKGIFCRTKSIAMMLKIMCTYARHVTLGSRCKMASSHRVTDLEKIPVLVSQDEAPTPWSVVMVMAFVYFLLVISSFSNLAWHFSLFRSVYSSFHNRLDLIREPAFYWVFYFIFPIYPCLFHHMYKWTSFVRSSSID